jgi:hypothetical protein
MYFIGSLLRRGLLKNGKRDVITVFCLSTVLRIIYCFVERLQALITKNEKNQETHRREERLVLAAMYEVQSGCQILLVRSWC